MYKVSLYGWQVKYELYELLMLFSVTSRFWNLFSFTCLFPFIFFKSLTLANCPSSLIYLTNSDPCKPKTSKLRPSLVCSINLRLHGFLLPLVFYSSSEMMDFSTYPFIHNQPCSTLWHFLGRTELPILLFTFFKIYCFLIFPVLVTCFANYIVTSFGTRMIYFLSFDDILICWLTDRWSKTDTSVNVLIGSCYFVLYKNTPNRF